MLVLIAIGTVLTSFVKWHPSRVTEFAPLGSVHIVPRYPQPRQEHAMHQSCISALKGTYGLV